MAANADLITADEHGNVDVLALIGAQQTAKHAATPAIVTLGQGPRALDRTRGTALEQHGAQYVHATSNTPAEAAHRARWTFRPGVDDDLVAV